MCNLAHDERFLACMHATADNYACKCRQGKENSSCRVLTLDSSFAWCRSELAGLREQLASIQRQQAQQGGLCQQGWGEQQGLSVRVADLETYQGQCDNYLRGAMAGIGDWMRCSDAAVAELEARLASPLKAVRTSNCQHAITR